MGRGVSGVLLRATPRENSKVLASVEMLVQEIDRPRNIVLEPVLVVVIGRYKKISFSSEGCN